MKYAILLFALVSAGFSQKVMLADSLSTYCSDFAVTEDGRVIFIRDDGTIGITSTTDPGRVWSMVIDWGWTLEGWGDTGRVFRLSGSPDGRLICFTQFISVPDELIPDTVSYVPSPLMVAVCTVDGTDPRLLGLSFDAGGGPEFSFTQDSRFCFGSPWLECDPTPEGFLDLFAGDQSGMLDPWLMVDVADMTRSGDPHLLGDGFLDNPYSDLIATGAYPPDKIVDIVTGEVLLENDNFDDPAIIEQWVLPRAGLAESMDGTQLIRLANGLERRNPGNPLHVFCRMPDGRYVFSEDGSDSVLLGVIDWATFTSPDAVEITGLSGLSPWYCTMKPLYRSYGVVFTDYDVLYMLELE